MYDEIFQDIHLTVVELPVELIDDKPHYTAYIKELPTISAEGISKKEVYQKLAALYQEYAEVNGLYQSSQEKSEEEITSSLLSAEQLLKYYDGESFDGFKINTDEPEG